MGKNNKKNNSSLLPLLAVGGLILLSGGKKNKKNTTTPPPATDASTVNNSGGITEQLVDNHFETVNDVTTITASDIVPYIVPSSFVVQKISDKYYYFDHPDSTNYDYEEKRYLTVPKFSFLICINVPATSFGSLKIENVYFDDLQFVRYINDQKQKWYKADRYILDKLAEQFKGLEVYTGNNLFEISFVYAPNLTSEEMNMSNYSFEAVSIGLNIKYEETRLQHWRMLSAWNIKEDTLINDGSALGTNTRFGVVRDANSKPRDQRGLFSEWWNFYVQSGYNTTIRKISASPSDYYLGNKF